MTTTNTTVLTRYTGNGVSTAFSFSFEVGASTEVTVYVDAVEQTSGFTVTLTGSAPTFSGGTVTFDAAPANGAAIVLRRETPVTQTTAIPATGAYDPNRTVEKLGLDRMTRILNEQRETLGRALHLPAYDAGSGTLPALTGMAGRAVAVTATEDGFEYVGAITDVAVNPMTTEGDTLIAGPSGAPRRMPKGTNVTLAPPSGFGWTPPVLPKYTPHGWRGDVALRTLRPALGSAAYYVDVLHGSSTASGQALAITAITQATPAVVTYTGTDPTNGNQVYVNDVAGMTEVNGRWFTVANVNAGANTFELSGEDSTGHTAYTSGGTATEALRAVSEALAKTDATVIYVAPGRYNRTRGWGTTAPATASATLAVLPWRIRAGTVLLGLWWEHTATSWENDVDLPNTWKATRSAVEAVRDYRVLTADGEAWPYDLAQSAQDCHTRRGTYYADGTSLWVHPVDEAMPGDWLGVFLTDVGASYTSTKTIYLEGLEFHGGDDAFNPNGGGAAGSILYAKDCKFLYAYSGNGLAVQGVGTVVLERCEAAFNAGDGFNYHAHTSIAPKVVEIDCRGHHNGWNRAGINNGSSMHDAGAILRIGGDYWQNEGPNVVDVGASTSWNVGVSARDSAQHDPTATSRADFQNDTGDMWCFDCTADGSEFSVVASNGATTRLDRITQRGDALESGAGTITTYTQG